MTPRQFVLCVDPGSVECGWAIIELDGPRCRYIAHGKADSTTQAFARVLREVDKDDAGSITYVALEVAEGHAFAPFRVPHLLGTAEFVGIVTAVAQERGVEVIRLTSVAVRKSLLGKASVGGRGSKKGATDQAIKAVVESNVVGWPKRSSVHARDAAAAGIVAAWMIAGRRKAG